MSRPTSQWRASPSMGAILARLAELYARALRVDAARRAKRVARLVQLVGDSKKP